MGDEAQNPADEPLDYESLIDRYNDNLATVLRGFRPAEAYLDTWVPDSDPAKSVLNLFEAAADSGVASVALFLGPTTVRHLDLGRLMPSLAALGVPEVRYERDGLVLKVSMAGVTEEDLGMRWADAVSPFYRSALVVASSRRRHERWLDAEAGLVRVEAQGEAVQLAILVDRESHVVRRAVYWNATQPIERGLIEMLCDVIVDTPIQEVADHAVVFVEHALRDHTMPPPVSGIVLPANADPMFGNLESIVRRLVEHYNVATGNRRGSNCFQRPPSPAWCEIAPDARAARVQKVVDELVNEHGYGSGVRVLRADESARVTVRFEESVRGALAQDRLRRLEIGLRARLEPTLQVYLEELKDRNVIRTLAPQKEPPQ